MQKSSIFKVVRPLKLGKVFITNDCTIISIQDLRKNQITALFILFKAKLTNPGFGASFTTGKKVLYTK